MFNSDTPNTEKSIEDFKVEAKKSALDYSALMARYDDLQRELSDLKLLHGEQSAVLQEIVLEAKDYEARSGKKIVGGWLQKAENVLTRKSTHLK